MIINYTINESKQIYILEGKLDQSSYSEFERFINENYDKGLDVSLNLEGLDYISSVGLRTFIILARKVAQNKCSISAKVKPGSMPENILKLSGFTKLIAFE